MLSKLRLMFRYYSEMLQWPFRRFWRWGMFLQPGEYREIIDLNIETDAYEFDGELQFVRLNFTDREVLEIWKKAYLAKKHKVDFIQIGKKGVWYGANGMVPVDDTVLRIGPDFMTVVAFAANCVEAQTEKQNYLHKVFDHFGLPTFQLK
ncbi:hypothetical protein [Thalassospira sp. CH_XMU1420-2]|uniref:hypothetical protein n=1 Tax=Thalassospira sp. CH_XMU1420-2 TaxID=3107769 RepID=UPI00300BD9DE